MTKQHQSPQKVLRFCVAVAIGAAVSLLVTLQWVSTSQAAQPLPTEGVQDSADAASEVTEGPEIIDGEYIVVLHESPLLPNHTNVEGAAATAQRSRVASLVQDVLDDHDIANASAATRNKGNQLAFTYTSALAGFAAELDDDTRAALEADPRVEFISPNARVQASQAGNQPNPTWGLDRIDEQSLPLDGNYSYFNRGEGVTAYVIDSGIRSSHQDFGGRVLNGVTAIFDGFGTGDCNGHGTHVAGTIGGARYGVAKSVALVPVRVLDCDNAGTWGEIISGIDWVAQNARRPAVANLSLGGSGNNAVDAAVRNLVASGVTTVVASGNDNSDACFFSPARVGAAITVNASTVSDNRSSFSNFGSCTDLFGPGSGVTSAWNRSNTDTLTISGTSMATPHVAGAIALHLSANPNLSDAQIKDILIADSTKNVISGAAGSPNRLLRLVPPSNNPPPNDSTTERLALAYGYGEQFSAPSGGSFLDGDATNFQILGDPVAVSFFDDDDVLGADNISNEASDDANQQVVTPQGRRSTFHDFTLDYTDGATTYTFYVVDADLDGDLTGFDPDPEDGRYLILAPGNPSPPVGTTLSLIGNLRSEPVVRYADIAPGSVGGTERLALAYGYDEQFSIPSSGSFLQADATNFQILGDPVVVTFFDDDDVLGADNVSNEASDDPNQQIVTPQGLRSTFHDFTLDYTDGATTYTFLVVDVDLDGDLTGFDPDPEDGRYLILAPGSPSPRVGTTLNLIGDLRSTPVVRYADIAPDSVGRNERPALAYGYGEQFSIPTSGSFKWGDATDFQILGDPVVVTFFDDDEVLGGDNTSNEVADDVDQFVMTDQGLRSTFHDFTLYYTDAARTYTFNVIDVDLDGDITGDDPDPEDGRYLILAPGSPVPPVGTTLNVVLDSFTQPELRYSSVSPNAAAQVQIIGADAPTEVMRTTTCLAGNGRVDINLVNTGDAAAAYRIEFGSLSPRQLTVAAGDWWRMAFTGRQEGDHQVVVKRDGVTISDAPVTVSCDSEPPVITSPEVQVVNACRNGSGFLLFQFANRTAAQRGWAIEFENVPNRSTSAAGFAASVRAVTGRPDGIYDAVVRVGSDRTEFQVTVDCD